MNANMVTHPKASKTRKSGKSEEDRLYRKRLAARLRQRRCRERKRLLQMNLEKKKGTRSAIAGRSKSSPRLKRSNAVHRRMSSMSHQGNKDHKQYVEMRIPSSDKINEVAVPASAAYKAIDGEVDLRRQAISAMLELSKVGRSCMGSGTSDYSQCHQYYLKEQRQEYHHVTNVNPGISNHQYCFSPRVSSRMINAAMPEAEPRQQYIAITPGADSPPTVNNSYASMYPGSISQSRQNVPSKYALYYWTV